MINLDDLDPTKEYDLGQGWTFKPVLGSRLSFPEDTIVGASVNHLLPNGEMCAGIVRWIKSGDDEKYNRPIWDIIQRNPLTLDPSIQCPRHPESHGYIREGKWVNA